MYHPVLVLSMAACSGGKERLIMNRETDGSVKPAEEVAMATEAVTESQPSWK